MPSISIGDPSPGGGQQRMAAGWPWLAVLALLLACAPRGWAAAYTVPGDFPTIQAALNAAVAGDTITVQAGTYYEKLVFPRSGDATNGFITLQAAPGPRPVLDGTGVAGANMVLIDSRSYVKIIGFEIRNDFDVRDGSGVRVLGAGDHIEIRDNLIHDIRGQNAMGITVYGTAATSISNLIIDGNEIYDCDPARSEALTLNGNVEQFQVTNNIVRDVNNIGIDFIGGETDIQPDSTKVARNGICRGNQVYRARSTYGGGFADGIYVDGGQNIVIEDNVVSQSDLGIEVGAEHHGIVASGIVVRDNRVYNNDKAGIVFGGYASSVGRVENCQFLNNTCYQNDTLGAGFGELWIQYASNNVVRNNIFFSTTQNILVTSDAGNVANQLDYNLWFTAAGAGSAQFSWNGTAYTGFDVYRAGTGQDSDSLFGDPLLVDPAAADFHLSSGSPAIDAGDPAFVAAPGEVDIDGQPRVLGGRVDIGADEATSLCGNGTVDPGEQCDDGNLVNGDGCDNNCTVSACGNGIVDPGEQCDDGNANDNDGCKNDCTLNVCGDGVLNVGIEQCDDGNLVNGDGCQADCTLTPRYDSVVLPVRPVNIRIGVGQTTVTRLLAVRVRNADVIPSVERPGHEVRLVASDGDCPPGTVGTPDFDRQTAGAQDTAEPVGGQTTRALVPLTISSAAFTSYNSRTPHRCRLTLTAQAVVPAGNIDPTPANNSVGVELNVFDLNDPAQTAVHESFIDSLPPVTLRLARGKTTAVKNIRVRVGNADVGASPGDAISVTTSDGDCPAGTLGLADFGARATGPANVVTVAGGRKQRGTVPLTIDAAAFTSRSAKAPVRCTATVTATGPGGDTDASNNTTQVVIDVIDRNDF